MEMDNAMAYWYHLRALARAGNWDGMRKALADNAAFGLGGHDTLDSAFVFAAREGQVDILDAMYKQGFVQLPEDAEESLETLGRHSMPQAVPAIAYLVNDRHVSPEKMLNALAVKGDAKGLEALEAAGVNIFASSSVFFLAFFCAKGEAMEFLFEKGAALYHPTNIKGLYKRKSEPGEAGLAAFAKLVASDQAAGETALQSLGQQPRTLAECREPCLDERGRKTTVMHLQARAGFFSRTVAMGLAEDAVPSPNPLEASDLFKKDAQGQTVLSILAARRELPLVLDPALWRRRQEEAMKVIDGLRDLDASEALDVEKFTQALHGVPSVRRRNVFAP